MNKIMLMSVFLSLTLAGCNRSSSEASNAVEQINRPAEAATLPQMISQPVAASSVAAASGVGEAKELSAKEHFELGRLLIEANHYDSMGSTQDGMAEGVRQINEAIRLQYADLKSAYLVLANAYDQWPVQPGENSEAEKLRITERSQVLRRLYQLYPDDLEVLDLYANRIADRKEKIQIYRHMLELNPKSSDPHFMLGLFYIEDGKIKSGIAESKLSIELEIDPSEIRNRAGRIAEAVVGQGCTLPEADEWGNQMMAVESELDIGIHSKEEVALARLRFAAIKKNFLSALEKVTCPAMK